MPGLQRTPQSRSAVWASCLVQLLGAAVWAAGLVLLPAPDGERGQRAWWFGVCFLAVGMTGNSADAIYHLAAYELTHPDVASTVALPVMERFQGRDLLLLLPSIGAFFGGLFLIAVAAVQISLVPRTSLLLFAGAVAGVAGDPRLKKRALREAIAGYAQYAYIGGVKTSFDPKKNSINLRRYNDPLTLTIEDDSARRRPPPHFRAARRTEREASL